MNTQDITTEGTQPKQAILAELRQLPMLSSLSDEQLACLENGTERTLEPDELLVKEGEMPLHFYFLLEGEVRVLKLMPGGGEIQLATQKAGGTFGELPLLSNSTNPISLRAIRRIRVFQIDADAFWRLMSTCPVVRAKILANMSTRSHGMQSTTIHQEKMAALGTLAAGLMHELNNPGAAAKRAASQLRQNLMRMHELSSKFSQIEMTREQKTCMGSLQQHALATGSPVPMSSLEQSDAEEALAEWMADANIADAWRLAPTLVATGIDAHELECARTCFPPEILSDAVSWLEALSSSMQLVGVVEESIGRVSDLVHAVKSYAYEGKGQKVAVDINQSIHATVVILGHKFREKQIEVEKDFGPDLPTLESDCSGLNQIWTNLLDNAIDAVKQHGHIKIHTWAEQTGTEAEPNTDLCISVIDDGEGMSPEVQQHIFDPFYTTKAVGVGTGLGLGIVHRIVTAYHGMVTFKSEPGRTEFLVRLPSKARITAE